MHLLPEVPPDRQPRESAGGPRRVSNPNPTESMKKLVALLAASVLTVTAFAGEYPDVSIAEVKALIGTKKATIIDVNGTESYKEGHVPGALDFDAVESKLASVLPEDKNALVIAYCGNPRCKAYQAAADAAHKLGYKNVKHMSAGIAGWNKAGEKVEKAK
jgi:rhodanese-related sulfurtransferase